MTHILFVDSDNGVELEPEWDYTDESYKIESTHRTQSGKEYRYKWASVNRFRFTLKWVSSSTAAVVNSWWVTNTNLRFCETGASSYSSVRLVNATKPIGSRLMPYLDQFAGIIELETY